MVSRSFRGIYYFCFRGRSVVQAGRQRESIVPAYLTLVSRLAFSSAPKLKATRFTEKSVDFERNTRRYIPEYDNYSK
jgi:hypothetical protein